MFFWAPLLWLIAVVCSQPPDVEFRAMWIATVNNMDFPSAPALPTSVQTDELLTYLDLLQDTNFNTAIFQIRPVGDALYNSPLDPWSKYLTGTQGVAPDPLYDPLEFFVAEAHSRGIEVHAWFNPYRANMASNWDGLHESHIANRLSQYAYPYSDFLWMDPGVDEVLDHVISVVNDILTRYDVDAIHFDDYFYPYKVPGVHFPDNATYENYLNGGGSFNLEDWRRDNINRMVQRVYNATKSFSKKLSISPFGLYRTGHPDGMPPPLTGHDPYSGVYADTKLWLQQGWLDMFIPQIYWQIDPPQQSYPAVLDWWLDNNILNKTIYAGHASYKTNPDKDDWPVSEIQNQVEISRQEANRVRGSLGNCQFNAAYFRDNNKGLVDVFRTEIYTNTATIPAVG